MRKRRNDPRNNIVGLLQAHRVDAIICPYTSPCSFFSLQEQMRRVSRAEETTWTWPLVHHRAWATYSDNPAALAHVLYTCGLNAFALGEWKLARSDFEHTATSVSSAGQFMHDAYPPHGLGLLCLAEGREDEAASYLTEALTLAQRNHDMQTLCGVQAALAEWELLAGRPAAAHVRLIPLLDTPGPIVSYSKEALALLACIYLELSEADQAQALLEQVLTTARQAQMAPTQVQALRVQALLLSESERWEEAEQALQEALMLCRKMAAPYTEAKALYTAGVVSHDKRELAPARQQFEAALAICTRLGERLYALRIEQTLAKLP